MISFNSVTEFTLESEILYSSWLDLVIESEQKYTGELSYVFCSDSYLLDINQQYLNHDTYTDIITFDYCSEEEVSGDIFISIDRVRENALKYSVSFDEELLRVMAHGVLHLIGFGDKSEEESALMRTKENEKIKMFHVEQ